MPQNNNTLHIVVQQIKKMPTLSILGLGTESAVRPSSEPIVAMAGSKRAKFEICKD